MIKAFAKRKYMIARGAVALIGGKSVCFTSGTKEGAEKMRDDTMALIEGMGEECNGEITLDWIGKKRTGQ